MRRALLLITTALLSAVACSEAPTEVVVEQASGQLPVVAFRASADTGAVTIPADSLAYVAIYGRIGRQST